ncbi:XdhC family protein [Parasulfitobacter algicola]|uniref:XdhC family protein n=1 Tax=Parasulfitobacter algicola TaxID=2614809 RepID=A0ABX2IYD9_9RHOB|nr:XdhC family protein [Sulfitobacter algicola]NSX55614.1 XdhC family protein [Sulfitobacter algicola]
MSYDYDNMPKIALDWHNAGKGAALATVIETWGSAPRPVGSQLVISGNGEMAGSVSGGCVEGAVVVEAIEALDDGQPRILEYGVSDDEAFAVGLACGGTIRVLVEPVGKAVSIDILTQLIQANDTRQPIAYVIDIKSSKRHLDHDTNGVFTDLFRSDKSGFEGDQFVAIHNPPLRMAIVGAVHIAQALVPMAQVAGYDLVLIDPRDAFGSSSRFPGQTILNDWPDEALTDYGLDMRTAVVTLTHDPKLDDPALHVALRSDAFYIGCLGSTRTHAKRIARLQDAGFSESDIKRLHAPVGLDIGAKSPAEIAISILAQVTETLRRG